MTGSEISLLLALWMQGALAFVLLWVLGSRRLPRIARGEISISDIALDKSAWPDDAQKASNAFDNQFQLPVLLFLAGGMALYLGPTLLDTVLAWLFVASRIIHAAIHVTSNAVRQRFVVYLAGFALLVVFWLVILVRLLGNVL